MMYPYVGPDLTQADVELEQVPKTGLLSGLTAQAQEGLLSTSEGSLLLGARNALYNLISPGKTLTPAEWFTSPYYFEGGEFHSDISEATARLAKLDHDSQVETDFKISNMKSGWFPYTAKFLTGVATQLADPIALATEAKVSELLGLSKSLIQPGLAEASIARRIAYGAATGAARGAAFVSPSVALEQLRQEQEGHEFDPVQALMSVGEAASITGGIGGLVHGIFKSRPLIDKDYKDGAVELSATQSINDIRPDVSYIVREGYNKASRATDFEPATVEALAAKAKIADAAFNDVQLTPSDLESINAQYPHIENVEDLKTHMETLETIEQTPYVENTPDGFKTFVDSQRSLDRNSNFVKDFENKWEDFSQSFSKEQELPFYDALDEEANRLKANGELPEEETKLLNELDKQISNVDTIDKLIRSSYKDVCEIG